MPLPGHRPGTPAYRRMVAALFLAGLATFATFYYPQPLLPLIAERYGVDAASSTLAISTTTLGLGVALLVLGPISEAYGRVRLMLGSLAAIAVVTLACAVVASWPFLLCLRVVTGLVGAGLPAVAVAYLREEVHPAALSRATGSYIGGTAIGGMCGRLLTGAVADAAIWAGAPHPDAWATAAIGLLGLGCALAVVLLLPRSAHFRPVALNPAALWQMTKAMLTDPVLVGLYVIGFTTMGAFVGTFNAIGFRLTAAPYRLSPAVVGLIFVVYALGSVAASRAGRLADRFGQRAVVPVTLGITVVGLALTLAQPLVLVIIGLAVLTAGFFACHAVVSSWVALRSATLGPGTAQAASLYLCAYYLVSSVFGAVAGWAWVTGGWPLVTLTLGALVILAGLVALLLRRVPVRVV